MDNWFTSLASQAAQLADQLTEQIVQTANEAQQTIERERERIQKENKSHLSSSNKLPWETDNEAKEIFSQGLMESILALSLSENNFLHEIPSLYEAHLGTFDFNSFVPTAMRVLELDGNLSRVHAKLMPHMDEEVFWRNYYKRITYLRLKSGIDTPTEEQSKAFKFTSDEEASIIYPPESVTAAEVVQLKVNRREPAQSPVKPQDSTAAAVASSSSSRALSTAYGSTESAVEIGIEEQTRLKAQEDERKRKETEDAVLADEVNAELDDLDEDFRLDDLDDMAALDMEDLDEQDLLDDILDDPDLQAVK